jgi:hypothetical protein
MAGISTAALAILAGTSTVSSLYSQHQAAKGAKAMGEYEGKILETNARYADEQAEDALARGKEEEDRHKAAVRMLIGSQRTAIAAQGIELGSGSALDLQLEAEGLGALDALTIRNNARRESFGYKVQATDYRNRASLSRMGAIGQARGIQNQQVTTLLTGAAQIGSIYSNRK